jgi:hypothetical protein
MGTDTYSIYPGSTAYPAKLIFAATSHMIAAFVLLDPELAAGTLFQFKHFL